jgi:hypothetical protein
MPQMGFEPTIPVFERAKTVHALDRATTVIDLKITYHVELRLFLYLCLLQYSTVQPTDRS